MKYKYDKDYFTEIVNTSLNLSDVCRKLGIVTTKGNRDTVKKYIEKYNIDVSHFTYGKSNTNNFLKKELKDVLIEDSSFSTYHLKNRLYKEELKKPICELCGQDEKWNGMKISMILDHINGINNDHRLENLRIICPNCDSGLPTFSGKNVNNKYKYKKEVNYCKCGEIITTNAEMCTKCSSILQRKVERPPYKQLINEISELGYKGTGRKYGVSDTSIRKWKRRYEKLKNKIPSV